MAVEKFPNTMLELMHTDGPPHCRDMVQRGWLTRPTLSHLQGTGNFLVSLHLFSLELLCTILSQSSILGWFWILGSLGGSMCISRWKWLKINCGPTGSPLVQCRAQGLEVVYWLYGSIIRWSINFASLCISSLVALDVWQPGHQTRDAKVMDRWNIDP